MEKQNLDSTKRDAGRVLSEHIASTNYTAIPKEVVERTKMSILDTLGVTVGGSGAEPGSREAIELAKRNGGREESTILVFGGKVPAMMAAFANGAMTHALVYDDCAFVAGGHATSATLAAGLAVAERVGKVSGEEFITAITIGVDLIVRMTLSVAKSKSNQRGWYPGQLFGTFSSTAVAGRLLRLDEDKLANAFGIALLQAAGTNQMLWSADVGIASYRDAFPAMAGVLSAELAEGGVTGIRDSLESKAGLYNLYFCGDYNPSFLTDKLGERFEGVKVGYKPLPVCGYNTTYVAATLEIVQQYDIHPEDIAEITVSYNDSAWAFYEPFEKEIIPPDRTYASLSTPFCVATAAAKREINLASFNQDSLDDPITLEIARKVKIRYAPELNAATLNGALPGIVEIKTKSGKSYQKRQDYPYGHPNNPITREDLIEKFRNCVAYAAKRIPKRNVDKVIELVLNLEKVDNMTQIIQLLA